MNKGIYESKIHQGDRVVRFKRMHNYSVPPKMRHQIIHNKRKDDVGIVVSCNGERGFRKNSEEVCYWFAKPYAYVVSRPIGGKEAIVVDLGHLV